ncbi:MAG: hypothetical protein RIF41_04930 [Polyangiaceae bacterium]
MDFDGGGSKVNRSIKGRVGWAVTLGICAVVGAPGCGDDDGTGRACESADDCYVDVNRDDLAGEVECLDRVEGGYCTHFCDTDADCCAVEGECPSGAKEVCAPFENSTQKRCFLSCEDGDLDGEDPDTYCQDFAHRDFGCRSTGGGSENRKVCTPPG